MSLLDAYLRKVRRERIRLWFGFTAANLACLGIALLMLYV